MTDITDVSDVSDTTEAKSNQLGASDFTGGVTKNIKITKVSRIAESKGLILNYENENGKPFYPCKTVRRILQHFWTKDAKLWVGKSMTLFCDPEVTYGGEKTGGVRVSHLSDIKKQETISLRKTNKSVASLTIKPLVVAPVTVAAKEVAPVSEIIIGALESVGAMMAASGISAYKNWLAGLTPEQKASIKQYHSEWSRVAKEADGG
jgi:hypothetical protein